MDVNYKKDGVHSSLQIHWKFSSSNRPELCDSENYQSTGNMKIQKTSNDLIFIQLFSYSHVLCPDSFFTLKCSHKISFGAYAMTVTIHTLASLAAKRLSSTSTMSMPCADVEHEFMLSATSRKQYQCYQYGQEQTEAPNHDNPTKRTVASTY